MKANNSEKETLTITNGIAMLYLLVIMITVSKLEHHSRGYLKIGSVQTVVQILIVRTIHKVLLNGYEATE